MAGPCWVSNSPNLPFQADFLKGLPVYNKSNFSRFHADSVCKASVSAGLGYCWGKETGGDVHPRSDSCWEQGFIFKPSPTQDLRASSNWRWRVGTGSSGEGTLVILHS